MKSESRAHAQSVSCPRCGVVAGQACNWPGAMGVYHRERLVYAIGINSEYQMTRSEGERLRARQALITLRATLAAVEGTLDDKGAVGADTPQAVATGSHILIAALSRLNAYEHAERDET